MFPILWRYICKIILTRETETREEVLERVDWRKKRHESVERDPLNTFGIGTHPRNEWWNSIFNKLFF